MALKILWMPWSGIFKREVGDAAETPEIYLRRTAQCLERVEELMTVGSGPKCNQVQCRRLVDKVKIALQSGVEVMYTWRSTCASPVDMARSLEIFRLLFALSKEVEDFILSCCNDAWIFQSAVRLRIVSDRISSLSFSLEIFITIFGVPPSLTLSEAGSVRNGEAEAVAGLDEQILIQVSSPSGAEWQLVTLLLKSSERERQRRLGRNFHGSNQSRAHDNLGWDVDQAAQILRKDAHVRKRFRLRTLTEAWWSLEPTLWAKAPRCFSMDEIRRMTNSFSNRNRLSWGALTMVYEGIVVDTGEVVVVKRILENYSRCPEEFRTQIRLLSHLHHSNLVRYVGFCCEDDETSLVFEYMANGTLDKYLHVRERKDSLTWPVRRNICLGVASGVHFLHSLGQARIAHCHIRSSSVLLDQNLNPKLSLQLALLASDDKSELQSPRYFGSSLGCLAPDCGTSLGQGSEIADVHNLGVLLLEIVSGRRRLDRKLPEGLLHLKHWARKLQLEGRSHELIDPTLVLEQFEVSEAVRIIQIALLCVDRAQDTLPEIVGAVLSPTLGHGKEWRFRMSNGGRQAGSCGSSSGEFPGSSMPDLNDFAEREAEVAGGTEEGEFSDASFEARICRGGALERDALNLAVAHLCSGVKSKVMKGFDILIKFASTPGGPLAVINAKYMPDFPASPDPSPASPAASSPIVLKAVELAKTQDPQYSQLAVKLMVTLTSDAGGEFGSVIVEELAPALAFLIPLMREKRLTPTLLLAAETVANMSVNKELRKTLWSHDGIVPAFVALSNAQHLKRAEDVCLKGLKHLANCDLTGDKTQTIVAALIKLLHRGLNFEPEMTSLVKDSLVALKDQVLAIEHATPSHKVCLQVWKEMTGLMLNEGPLDFHNTIPGRMAIVSLMMTLCAVYKDDMINVVHLFRFLLKMIKRIGSEITNLLEASQPLPPGKLKELRTLLALSVDLLCVCVSHAEDIAQISGDAEGRKTLEELFVLGGGQGISDACRLQILSILNQANPQGTLFPGGMEFLVAMSKSPDQLNRQQVGNALRMLVAEKKNLAELKDAGGVAVLMALLQDPIRSCQRDALIAVHGLPQSVVTPIARQLPLQNILTFLDEEWPSTERTAAVGLLHWMVKEKAVSADVLVRGNGTLQAILLLIENGFDSPDSRKSACALFFEMVKADPSVCRRIAEPGLRALDILVKSVRDHVRDHADDSLAIELKNLLTATLVLFCGRGQGCQEAVIRADGHGFLISCLRENKLRENASQGLLELIRDSTSRKRVLEAGFLTIALESIDARFACTSIAQSLALISSTRDGLDRIYSDSGRFETLLNLLDHYSDPQGQGAAALVIARLYPYLPEPRQTRIAERGELFFRHLKNVSQCKEFLEALAVIATKVQGRKLIHEARRHQFLVENLKSSTEPDILHLVLKILAELSSDAKEDRDESRDAMMIRGALMKHKVYENLFNLLQSTEFVTCTENVECALIIIRNLSLAGPYACETLAEQDVVTLLLNVLKNQESSVSDVSVLAVKALEKFLGYPRGTQALLKLGGIKPVTTILKLAAFGENRDAKSFSISALIQVAKHPQTREPACRAIFKCDILGALNQIILISESDKIRWQAAVLMQLLVGYGPTGDVCNDMEAKGCLDALIDLRARSSCRDTADTVMKYVSDRSKKCKRFIDSRLTLG